MKCYNIPNIIPASTVMNTTINSSAIQLYDAFSFAIEIIFTGTPTGSFKLQMSCDKAYSGAPNSSGSGLNASAVNWSDIASTSTNVTAAGSVNWNIANPGYNWVRAVYTDTSSGVSTAIVTVSTFNGKGF